MITTGYAIFMTKIAYVGLTKDGWTSRSKYITRITSLIDGKPKIQIYWARSNALKIQMAVVIIGKSRVTEIIVINKGSSN